MPHGFPPLSRRRGAVDRDGRGGEGRGVVVGYGDGGCGASDARAGVHVYDVRGPHRQTPVRYRAAGGVLRGMAKEGRAMEE